MNEPLRLTMKTTELSLNGIEQYFVAAQDDLHKYELLKAIYNKLNQCSSIIFVNGIKRVNSLHEAMEKDGFLVHKMHSSLDKEQRAEVLSNFKNTSNSILISSDLTAKEVLIFNKLVWLVILIYLRMCIPIYIELEEVVDGDAKEPRLI